MKASNSKKQRPSSRRHGRELFPGSQELKLEVEEHEYHLQDSG